MTTDTDDARQLLYASPSLADALDRMVYAEEQDDEMLGSEYTLRMLT